jgi:Domain of unknown function (DUF4124)
MHLRKTWVLLSLLSALAAQAGVIYKWTDADGVVHYSDQESPGAEKIFTSGIPSNGSANRGSPARGTSVAGSQVAKPVGGLNYSQFAISSPVNDQTFFNDDVVSVHLVVDPALKPNQTITWHLSGRTLTDQAPDSQSFALQSLERGTYVLAATVIDQATGDSQTTPSVTFYVRQPSQLSPLHR